MSDDASRLNWIDSFDYVVIARNQRDAVPWSVTVDSCVFGIGMTPREAIDAAMSPEGPCCGYLFETCNQHGCALRYPATPPHPLPERDRHA